MPKQNQNNYYKINDTRTSAVVNNIERLEKKLRLNPSDIATWFLLGEEYFKLGDYQKTLAACQIVLQKNPSYAKALALLGLVYENSGERLKAMGYYARALDISPNNRLAKEHLSNLYCNP